LCDAAIGCAAVRVVAAFRLAVTTLAVACTSAASACTVCDSPPAEQVRARILDGQFATTLAAVLLPFPILLAVVAVIQVACPPRRSSHTRSDHVR
jgi:hypothetical protein